MIYNEIAIVKSNKKIADNTFQAILYSPKISKDIKPGQFINILPSKGWDKVMRRPMSISSTDQESLNIIYKIVGEGTLEMSNWINGNKIDIIGPLGNHWTDFKKEPIIVGGGVGIAPILFLHEFLLKKKIKHTLIMGARDIGEHFLRHSIKDDIILGGIDNNNICTSKICTFEDQKYYSYRRGDDGRIYSAMSFKE